MTVVRWNHEIDHYRSREFANPTGFSKRPVLKNQMRDAMRRQTASAAILATRNGHKRAGILATLVISVSFDSPSVLISINRSSSFYRPVRGSRRFSVNWLGATHDPLGRAQVRSWSRARTE
jgi:flavin reductase (DIM6/NTAB) family NADH-FMN oxidoreductase RutF